MQDDTETEAEPELSEPVFQETKTELDVLGACLWDRNHEWNKNLSFGIKMKRDPCH